MPQRDPHGAFNFEVEIDGATVKDFLVADLPRLSTVAISVREGSDRVATPRKLVGGVDTGELVLIRGYDGNPDLWRWFEAVTQGGDDRRTVTVKLLNRRREPVGNWRFIRAWPAAYEGPRLDAAASELATETLYVTCDEVRFEV